MIRHNLPWLESPFFKAELAASALSEKEKESIIQFAEHGYLIFDPGIQRDVIDLAREKLEPRYNEAAQERPTDREASYKLQDEWQHNEPVKKIASAPAIMQMLELLYRRRPLPFQTLNFRAGSQQDTHSDMIHFSSVPERFMCGVWVALEDITEEMGPLHFYPGSHKLPFYSLTEMDIPASRSKASKNIYMDYEDYYVVFIQEVIKSLELQKKILTLKKGQAMIWAANLLHGGEPILRQGASRHSQVTHYYFDNCTYYTPLFTDFVLKDIYLRHITDIATGERIENKYLGKAVKLEGKKELIKKLFLKTK